jgi:serine/threonine protein kinase
MNSPPPHQVGQAPLPLSKPNAATTGIGELGRYRLLSRLAIGGMAEIFLAKVEGIGGFEKVVVVKRMIPQYAEDPILVRMFMDEARLLAKLDHPNITQVHDVGTQAGQYYFAMEFVHGEDLRSITRAAALNDVSLGDTIIASLIASAANALHYVHEKRADDGRPLNIVHRDVSPSNILVAFNGTVKLADFGVAKWDDQQTRTTHGTLKGKLAYMSPEQAKGAAIDRRSDVFSLGVLMFEMFTGTRLFQGATEMAILEQVTSGAVPNPTRRRPDLPKSIERIIRRALDPLPENRFPTAQDVARALEEFISVDRKPCDPQTISALLTRLFSRKLATWYEAEQGGFTLAEHLARLPAADVLPVLDIDSTSDSADNITKPELQLPALALAGEGFVPKASYKRNRSVHMIAWGTGIAACVAAVAIALWPATRVTAPTQAVPIPTINSQNREKLPIPSAPKLVSPVTEKRNSPQPELPSLQASARKKRTNAAQRSKRDPVESTPKPTNPDNVRVWDPDSVLLPK